MREHGAMPLCNKSFEEELDLVEWALQTEQGEIELKKYLLPLVRRVTARYAEPGRAVPVGIGFEHYDFALAKYHEHALGMQMGLEEPYKFSTYFTWFIRQDVVAFLEE